MVSADCFIALNLCTELQLFDSRKEGISSHLDESFQRVVTSLYTHVHTFNIL